MRAAARFFKSRSDETRWKILWLWSGAGELCAGDVIDVLDITQSQALRGQLADILAVKPGSRGA